MKKWKRYFLRDAYWFQEGPGVRNTQFRDQGIKLLNVGNITKSGVLDLAKTNRYLDPNEVSTKYRHFMLDAGDLVIASSGISFDDDGLLRTRGAFVSEEHLPLCMNTSTIRFKNKDGLSDLTFLKHWLQSADFRMQITRLVTGSAQQNFGPSHLKRLQILLPPVSEQKYISKVLTNASSIVEMRKLALTDLESLPHALFIEMFGNPAFDTRWEFRRLEECSEIVSGIAKGGRKFDGQQTLFIPYLRVANVQAGYLDLTEVKTIEALPSDLEKCRLQRGDVLLTEGGDHDKLGRGALWDGQVDPCIHQNHIFRVRVNSQVLLPAFLAEYLQTEFSRNYFLKCAKRTTNLATINMTQLKALPVPIPPINLQHEFATKLGVIQATKLEYARHLSAANELFNSLLERGFAGDLHSKVVDDKDIAYV